MSKTLVTVLMLVLVVGLLPLQAAWAADAPAGGGQKKYKSVDEEEDTPERDYFKGKPNPYDNNLFFGAGADYFDSFGLQLRYAARLLKYGFIPDVNDSFYFEGGFGMTFYGEYRREDVLGFNFVFTGRWDFQMDPKWILFADLGFGYNAISGVDKDLVEGGGFFPAVGVGAMFNINDKWAVRGDLSYQFLGVGVVNRF